MDGTNADYRYGRARFAEGWEMKRAGLFKRKGPQIGFYRKSPLFLDGDAPMITIGGAGSGKLRDLLGYVVCNLPGQNMVVLDPRYNLFKPTLDYSGHIGALIGAEALVPVTDRIRLGGNIALTTKRGVLAGPAARYSFKNEAYTSNGSFISGYINDNGDPGRDVNNRLIDPDRYFAEWKHHQIWDGNRANLSAYARYWSDSEVTRDFYEDSFDTMQDPDSYLEANYNADNWQLSLFTRAALGDFQNYTERLPEIRFTYFPTALGHGFSHRGFLSAARLRQPNTSPTESISTNKVDSHYGVEWNRTLSDGVNLRLKAGARSFSYENAETTGYKWLINPPEGIRENPTANTSVNGSRAFGEIGADLNLKAHATYEFKNETWNIEGIRHIIEPKISYRYVPELWSSQALDGFWTDSYDPTVYFTSSGTSALLADQGAFANYLPSNDIENRRDVDNLREDHKIRFELGNRIQTRHKDGGSRDLARFGVAADYYLPGSDFAEEYYSLVNFDAELTPAPWLALGGFARLDPEDGMSVQEFNTHIALQDEGYWKVAFGSHFLDGNSATGPAPFLDTSPPFYSWQTWPNYSRSWPEYRNLRLEQYFAHLEYQFSENLKLYATARYDAESGVFYEQRIGIMQRALEQYGLKYELRFYDGDRSESDFGITIGIDLFDE